MKAICIDDEQLALDYLERQIKKMSNIEVIGKYLHPLRGKKHIIEEDVDVVFLDIQLPEMNGIELAEQIIKEKPEVIVVFVTAYNEFAVDAFEVNAIDYLIKPVKLDRLKVTMERVENQLKVNEKVTKNQDILRVKVADHLMFEVEKDVYKPIPWRTYKTQELFLYLLQNHGNLVEKTTLMELLWEDFQLEKGYALLYTTVYNVRKALREFGDHFILHNTSDGYLLELNNVKIDLVDWEEKRRELPTLNRSTIKMYEELMEQNKEPYLQKHDYIWIEAQRQCIEKLWSHTAHSIAMFYEKENDLESAIRWYKNICERHPEDEEAYFSIMKIYAKMGNHSLMIQQYEQLKKSLQETLATEPSKFIKKWFESQVV